MSSKPSGKQNDLTLDSIAPPAVAPSSPASEAIETLEKKELDQAQKLDLLKKQLGIQEQMDNIQGRGSWGSRIFWILLGWLIAVIACIGMQAFHAWGFHLSDPVLIAFISTTTVNVLGLGYIVARHFFQQPKE
jgi:hypothetical protein